jgi:hypothetical protein
MVLFYILHLVVCKYWAVILSFARLVQSVSSALLIYLILACEKKNYQSMSGKKNQINQ